MDRRAILLPIAAIAIAAACYWKVNRQYEPQPRAEDLTFPRPAPLFTLPDQKSQLFRLRAYVGRHDIFIVFFDGEKGVANSDILNYCQARLEDLKERNIIVIGISEALPQENIGVTQRSDRDSERFTKRNEYPFPLLTDLDGSIHQLWGRYDEEQQATLTGTFHINRAGDVEAKQEIPEPLAEPIATIRKYLGDDVD